MKYSDIKYYDIADGPGVRTSLFVSGCTHHCHGCFNPETWDFNNGAEFTEETENDIILSLAPRYVSGFTLLGGEPMEPKNQRGVIGLVRKIKQIYADKTIWCYTGYTYKKDFTEKGCAFCEITAELLSYFDVLVDGEYVERLHDVSLKFRGSSNQRIIDLRSV